MPRVSVLFLREEDRSPAEALPAPEFFADLRLDDVLRGATRGREEYGIAPFYLTPLPDAKAIRYRHEVFRDLENPDIAGPVTAFSDSMKSVRDHLRKSEKLYYAGQTQRWFLDAVAVYCDAVLALHEGLAGARVSSRGLRAFREYPAEYSASRDFGRLRDETKGLLTFLGEITYGVWVRDGNVTVRRYEGEPDFSEIVVRTFARFRDKTSKDYSVQFDDFVEMNSIEAQVLDGVARLYPEVFRRLENFYKTHTDFIDETIAAFDREVQFYLSYLEFIRPLRDSGPQMCAPGEELCGKGVFDISLARALGQEGRRVVCNDWGLGPDERVFVVSGPNHGGKTTFARAFGQVHYLGKIGCPVPGREARLLLYDRLFTHLERQEDMVTLAGRLEDDLLRMRAILDAASERSIVIINEMLSSTTLSDGIDIGSKLVREIRRRGAVAIWVTFIEELAYAAEGVVSLVSTVDPRDPSMRTYIIDRRPPGGVAYALSVAAKYGLTYEVLRERIRS